MILYAFLVGFIVANVANGQIDLPCGDAASPYDDCSAPENCAGSLNGCGCACPACGSCTFATNPTFETACAANVVLVLDESASIWTYQGGAPEGELAPGVEDVMLGATTFMRELSKGLDIGAQARLAVVEFSNDAEIVNAGQSNLLEMKSLTDEWVTALERYLDPRVSKPDGYSSYNPYFSFTVPSCTNWGAAAEIVKGTNWCTLNEATQTCEPTPPEVVVWFTDGKPTTHDGVCDKQCNANRERADRTGLVGPDNGGDIGPACFWADQIKQQGTKVFVVGVGGAASEQNTIQKISGPQLWDRNPDSWPTSDYVVDANFEDLGVLFYAIAKGLCKCLQDQAPCVNAEAPLPSCADQIQFDARIRVTSGPSGRESGFPPNSLTYGYIYYRFSSQPPVYSLELQAPGSDIDTTQNILSTKLYDACNVLRKEICADQCFSVSDKSFIPRFFVSEGDIPEGPSDLPTSSCGVPYLKRDAVQPESIQYVWLTDNVTLCAARAVDGTFYEFWSDLVGEAPGVNYRDPRHLSQNPAQPFPFDQFDNCQAIGQCSASVDLLYVVDRRFTEADYTNIKAYIVSLIRSYNNSAMKIRGGVYFNDPALLIPFTTDLGGLETAFNLVPALPEGGTIDFYATTTNAIETFWPDAFVSGINSPRYMLTVIGGADSRGEWSDAEVTAFQTLKAVRGVESWVVAVGRGASEISLARNIADAVPYNHAEILGSTSLLPINSVDQALRMCPSDSLCGPDCQGVCACGQCLCPDCVTIDPANKCLESCCDAESKLCAVSNKATLAQPLGCVPINPDPCVAYTCEAATGQCGVDNTCAASCGCDTVPGCAFNELDVNNCGAACNLKPIGCGCGNECGNVCNPETGLCGGVKNCDDGNSCTNDTCVVRIVGDQTEAVCINADITPVLCPRINECVINECVDNGTAVCVTTNISALYDLCGNCLGDNLGCAFITPSISTGGIVGIAFAAGLVAAAAIAALAAFAKRKPATAAGSSTVLQDQALMDNPAFKTPGEVGEMPDL